MQGQGVKSSEYVVKEKSLFPFFKVGIICRHEELQC